jgi:hypothetical protein
MDKDTGNVVVVMKPASAESPSLGPVGKAVREIFAITFWIYVGIKLFVFDLDVYLAAKFLPQYLWLLDLKFFILIGFMAIAWLFTKNKDIGLWLAFTVFYPAILIFWRIPVFLYKQESWILTFALINAIISFSRSIRFIFIGSSVFLVSVATILTSSSNPLLWLATGTILVLLLIAYVYRFVLVFKPSSIFQVHIKLFTGIREQGNKSFFVLDDGIKSLPLTSLDRGQQEKRTSNLQMAVLFNRACLFTAKKLRDYQNSGLGTISGILTILLLILLTIVSFAAINYGLYKIDPGLFEVSPSPGGFFIFFYYSFNNLIFSSIKEVVPIMPISQAASMTESFLAFFLGVILVSIILSVRSQKYSEALNQAIDRIEAEGTAMESFIRTEYSVGGIEDAIIELERVKATFISFIFKISKNIK